MRKKGIPKIGTPFFFWDASFIKCYRIFFIPTFELITLPKTIGAIALLPLMIFPQKMSFVNLMILVNFYEAPA